MPISFSQRPQLVSPTKNFNRLRRIKMAMEFLQSPLGLRIKSALAARLANAPPMLGMTVESILDQILEADSDQVDPRLAMLATGAIDLAPETGPTLDDLYDAAILRVNAADALDFFLTSDIEPDLGAFLLFFSPQMPPQTAAMLLASFKEILPGTMIVQGPLADPAEGDDVDSGEDTPVSAFGAEGDNASPDEDSDDPGNFDPDAFGGDGSSDDEGEFTQDDGDENPFGDDPAPDDNEPDFDFTSGDDPEQGDPDEDDPDDEEEDPDDEDDDDENQFGEAFGGPPDDEDDDEGAPEDDSEDDDQNTPDDDDADTDLEEPEGDAGDVGDIGGSGSNTGNIGGDEDNTFGGGGASPVSQPNSPQPMFNTDDPNAKPWVFLATADDVNLQTDGSVKPADEKGGGIQGFPPKGASPPSHIPPTGGADGSDSDDPDAVDPDDPTMDPDDPDALPGDEMDPDAEDPDADAMSMPGDPDMPPDQNEPDDQPGDGKMPGDGEMPGPAPDDGPGDDGGSDEPFDPDEDPDDEDDEEEQEEDAPQPGILYDDVNFLLGEPP